MPSILSISHLGPTGPGSKAAPTAAPRAPRQSLAGRPFEPVSTLAIYPLIGAGPVRTGVVQRCTTLALLHPPADAPVSPERPSQGQPVSGMETSASADLATGAASEPVTRIPAGGPVPLRTLRATGDSARIQRPSVESLQMLPAKHQLLGTRGLNRRRVEPRANTPVLSIQPDKEALHVTAHQDATPITLAAGARETVISLAAHLAGHTWRPVSTIGETRDQQINQHGDGDGKDRPVGNQPNVDEGIVLELSMFRRDLVRHLSSDGTYCDQDAEIVARFDAPHRELSRITRLRNALETVIRCGITRHSRGVAKEANVTFVAAGDVVTNVVQLPLNTKTRPMDGTPPDAA